MPRLVRARTPFVSKAATFDVVLGPNDILRDDNPHVTARPDMFEEVRETIPNPGDGIERATARPGEKSTARRTA